MNLLELIFKQMRQRALSTFITCASILLGMALATCIMIINYEGRSVFAQTDYGYDLIVGPKASPLALVMNTVYHLDRSPGNIPYAMYENMISGKPTTAEGKPNPYQGMVRWAVPYAVGDSYQGRRIVGTTPQLFGVDDDGHALPAQKIPEYRKDEHYSFAEGGAFHPRKFEAVIGSQVAKDLGMHVGATFQATHGVPTADFVPSDTHPETWTVVGVLNPTHTANDRVLFISLTSFYAIFEHEEGLEDAAKIKAAAEGTAGSQPTAPGVSEKKAYHLNADGTIEVDLPRQDWQVSALLVQSRSTAAMLKLMEVFRTLPDATAVNPADEMRNFFDTFLGPSFKLLVVISVLVTVVGAASILVSIYNSVVARYREIAIMRALGATRKKILSIVCLEAVIIGALGGVLGLTIGHALAAMASAYLRAVMGTGIAWWNFRQGELIYLAVVVAISLLAGLIPAFKAYQAPVAENLVG